MGQAGSPALQQRARCGFKRARRPCRAGPTLAGACALLLRASLETLQGLGQAPGAAVGDRLKPGGLLRPRVRPRSAIKLPYRPAWGWVPTPHARSHSVRSNWRNCCGRHNNSATAFSKDPNDLRGNGGWTVWSLDFICFLLVRQSYKLGPWQGDKSRGAVLGLGCIPCLGFSQVLRSLLWHMGVGGAGEVSVMLPPT